MLHRLQLNANQGMHIVKGGKFQPGNAVVHHLLDNDPRIQTLQVFLDILKAAQG